MNEQGILTLSTSAWQKAHLRRDLIVPLSKQNVIGQHAVAEVAQKLGLSSRQVYKLVRRCREGDGFVTDMASQPPRGGKGKGRLLEAVETIIQTTLHKRYLNRQKRSQMTIWKEITQSCRELGLKNPALNTIRLRIQRLDPYIVACKREGLNASRRFQSAGGKTSTVKAPLDQVQIDHSVVDIIIVDDISRHPIGRPYLTVAIDVYSRCFVGMIVTLEAPSATSVGLCLSHVVCDKRSWLERLKIDVPWPMGGKPHSLYLDNACEFKSEAFRRGCEQHGIDVRYRPPGQPHYGGIVERVIGTTMQRIHELPGTTFSNPMHKGDYDSDKHAILTLYDLERWLALAIVSYHSTVHTTLKQPPALRWSESVSQGMQPLIVTNPRAFLIDFLPVIRRKLCRTGFLIDHITYYGDVLKPWIVKRHQLDQFIIRRDPRDISRIWVLEPDHHQYLEIPYRTLSHPAITLWEHKKVTRKDKFNAVLIYNKKNNRAFLLFVLMRRKTHKPNTLFPLNRLNNGRDERRFFIS